MRSIILKDFARTLNIDGISATIVILMTDGLLGGCMGIYSLMTPGGLQDFTTDQKLIGLCAGR